MSGTGNFDQRKRMLNNRITYPVLILLALSLLPGCASNRATASLTPGTDLTRISSLYVVKSPEDERDINELIKTSLARRGYAVTTGTDGKPDTKVDALVTYADKWFWDITMYMLELTIILRNPATNFPLATGNSYHTSLTRKSKEEMVEEVLDNIFKTTLKADSK
jgi:hypothetical protein